VKFTKKALAILLAIIIAVAIGVAVSIQLTGKPRVKASEAYAEPVPPSYLDSSSILLLSTASSYGSYSFANAILYPGSTPIIEKGNSCFIVNATIQNDYSLRNLPPNQITLNYPNGTVSNESTSAYVFLTAAVYDKQGNVIQATDVTPPYGPPSGGAFVNLESGENATVTMYLATSRQDIDHFSIVLRYVGVVPLP
jgi:hypothetical protein